MLKALYDYAIQHELTLPAGYVKKTVKAYVSLSSADPTYVEIRMGDDEAVPCPDVGSLKNSSKYSNVLVDKRSVVVPTSPTDKSAFFKDALALCAEDAPEIQYCLSALQNDSLFKEIERKLDKNEIEKDDLISFMIDNRSILENDKVKKWWSEYRKNIGKQTDLDRKLCLVTGEFTTPIATFPGMNLSSVGGQGNAVLICFNPETTAYNSYGFKQLENAPISESAAYAIQAALDDLLKDAPTFTGKKTSTKKVQKTVKNHKKQKSRI